VKFTLKYNFIIIIDKCPIIFVNVRFDLIEKVTKYSKDCFNFELTE